MKRSHLSALVLLSMLLMMPLAGSAQQWGLGLKGMFNGGPTGLSLTQHLNTKQVIEYHFGHTQLSGAGTNSTLFSRGGWALGAAYQPRVLVGSRHGASGFYGNFGGRLRTQNRLIAGRENGGLNQNSAVLTPEVFAGGGVFLRAGDALELFGEIDLGYRRAYAHADYGFGLETGIGARLMFR